MSMQQYCLRWNNHQPNFISVFSSLLNNESLVDVTLATEGKHLQAHKVVLSACSSYFQSLFTINPCQHPIVILKDVKFVDLKVIVDFMYYGEVNVSQEQLPYILKTAEMLKIKGLAEIPVEQTLSKSHSISTEKTELLTPADSNWGSEGCRGQSSSPSPCPLSPSSRRKRLRKSSTGSGSGSGERERTFDEQQPQSEVLLTAAGGTTVSSVESVIKSDPGGSFDSTTYSHKLKQLSNDSELHRGGSHESVESEPVHQITLQVPQQQQDLHLTQNLENTSLEVPGTSAGGTTQHTMSVHLESAQIHIDQTLLQTQPMGTKRGRFLRQPRVKRESDPSQATDSDAPLHYLSVPPLKIERQYSEPLPAAPSPPPGSNLLTVPGAVLVKQHSHPLLPSQMPQSMSPPLHIQFISQAQHVDTAERAVSPVVVVTEALNTGSSEFLRADSAELASTSIIRVRTDGLKRSSSSPQGGAASRSSHCPMVRPGPALGCNYCWNTVDTHGRILRRKTKYHCPECQTNLCIVPCFQEYHERHSSTQTEPMTLTTSVMRMFPKTTSM